AHDSAAACGGGVHVIAADRVALVNATKGKARNAGRRLVEGVFAALSWLGSHEISVLLSAVVLSAGAWVFIELADEVTEGEAKSVDETVLLALRNPADLGDPVGPGWVEEMGRDFTAMGSMGVLTLITLAVLGYLLL